MDAVMFVGVAVCVGISVLGVRTLLEMGQEIKECGNHKRANNSDSTPECRRMLFAAFWIGVFVGETFLLILYCITTLAGYL